MGHHLLCTAFPPVAGRAALCLAVWICVIAGSAAPAAAARIKDIADIKGVRSNQMVGYGLVVGLDGTGDGKKAKFTLQSMATMLDKMGMTVKPEDIEVDNVASVMVTAELQPFARSGSRIDVTVSSIGDAKNLQGGTLLLTALKGVDGQVYAVAQGAVVTGGFAAGGHSGGSIQKNFPTVGRVVGGALIEREVPSGFADLTRLTLTLRQPDFTTARRMSEAINAMLFGNPARSLDAGTVEVSVPEKYTTDRVALVSLIEGLSVTPDVEAKVVINERTGTVVMGAEVRIATVAIAHGNLSIQIRETAAVSQPLPLSGGQTVVAPESDIAVSEGNAPIFLVPSGVNIGDVVRALNALGVSPRDLVAIFQAIKVAGALQAELEII